MAGFNALSNHNALFSTGKLDMGALDPWEQSMPSFDHDIDFGSPIPMTPFSRADQHKLALQQLGHGSPEDFHITPEQLDAQKAKLNPMTTVNTPFAENLTIAKWQPCSSAEFVDFATDTRAQLTQLASTTSGQELFAALDHQSTPDFLGERPPIMHSVNIVNPDLNKPGTDESATAFSQHGSSLVYQHDGSIKHSGFGSDVSVVHQPDYLQRSGDPAHAMEVYVRDDPASAPYAAVKPTKEAENTSMPSSVMLGHELIHAAHYMNGLGDWRTRPDGLLKEEANTVGSPSGQRVFDNIPTENMLRQDMSAEVFQDSTQVGPIPLRPDYGIWSIDSPQTKTPSSGS